MLWYALILGLVVGGVALLLTREVRQALRFGGIALAFGVVISLLITFSGLLGG